jgi:hypothetical protein
MSDSIGRCGRSAAAGSPSVPDPGSSRQRLTAPPFTPLTLGVALSLHWPSWLVVLAAIAAFNAGVAAFLIWLWFRDYI